MRISDWSSDVCSSDLRRWLVFRLGFRLRDHKRGREPSAPSHPLGSGSGKVALFHLGAIVGGALAEHLGVDRRAKRTPLAGRSEEHTSELQSLMRISYAVFCLQKKTNTRN